MRAAFKQLDSLTKLAVNLNVTGITDSATVSDDKDKAEKNKQPKKIRIKLNLVFMVVLNLKGSTFIETNLKTVAFCPKKI